MITRWMEWCVVRIIFATCLLVLLTIRLFKNLEWVGLSLFIHKLLAEFQVVSGWWMVTFTQSSSSVTCVIILALQTMYMKLLHALYWHALQWRVGTLCRNTTHLVVFAAVDWCTKLQLCVVIFVCAFVNLEWLTPKPLPLWTFRWNPLLY